MNALNSVNVDKNKNKSSLKEEGEGGGERGGRGLCRLYIHKQRRYNKMKTVDQEKL